MKQVPARSHEYELHDECVQVLAQFFEDFLNYTELSEQLIQLNPFGHVHIILHTLLHIAIYVTQIFGHYILNTSRMNWAAPYLYQHWLICILCTKGPGQVEARLARESIFVTEDDVNVLRTWFWKNGWIHQDKAAAAIPFLKDKWFLKASQGFCLPTSFMIWILKTHSELLRHSNLHAHISEATLWLQRLSQWRVWPHQISARGSELLSRTLYYILCDMSHFTWRKSDCADI